MICGLLSSCTRGEGEKHQPDYLNVIVSKHSVSQHIIDSLSDGLSKIEVLIPQGIQTDSCRKALFSIYKTQLQNENIRRRSLFLVGLCCMKQSDFISASFLFEDLVVADSSNATYALWNAHSLLLQGKTSAANSSYERAKRLGDTSGQKVDMVDIWNMNK